MQAGLFVCLFVLRWTVAVGMINALEVDCSWMNALVVDCSWMNALEVECYWVTKNCGFDWVAFVLRWEQSTQM
jgi:hypothetical protein